MRIKIVSDGTTHGTRVVNAETGEPIENVESLSWGLTAYGKLAVVDMRVIGVATDLIGTLKTVDLKSDN